MDSKKFIQKEYEQAMKKHEEQLNKEYEQR
jgi:hypothetical protein